jgi:co-chaperonin GroES (HSP10)
VIKKEWQWMREDHPSSVESQVKKRNKMKPIGKYILINPIDEEMETKSGLLLSAEDSNQFRYKKGMVVVPGTDVINITEKDTIYYDSRAGYTMMIGSESYTIIKEADVVVVL